MKTSTLYLVLGVAGSILAWIFLIAFAQSPAAAPALLLPSLFPNPLATAVAADLFASAALILIFVFVEGRRIGMPALWLYVLATLLGGLVLGVGLFFYRRARLLESGSSARAGAA